MKPAFFLAAAGRGQGLTTVALGLVVTLDRRGVRVSFYKPISEDRVDESREEIETVARSQDVVLSAELETLDPASIRSKYVRPLFELRKSK